MFVGVGIHEFPVSNIQSSAQRHFGMNDLTRYRRAKCRAIRESGLR